MPLIYQKRIYRADLRANPSTLYVFGDNVMRTGLKGQAKEMRNEPNAVGVATKWRPTMHSNDLFYDLDFERCWQIVMHDLKPVFEAHEHRRLIVWPSDGIGTGLSQWPKRAPKLLEALATVIKPLEIQA